MIIWTTWSTTWNIWACRSAICGKRQRQTEERRSYREPCGRPCRRRSFIGSDPGAPERAGSVRSGAQGRAIGSCQTIEKGIPGGKSLKEGMPANKQRPRHDDLKSSTDFTPCLRAALLPGRPLRWAARCSSFFLFFAAARASFFISAGEYMLPRHFLAPQWHGASSSPSYSQ